MDYYRLLRYLGLAIAQRLIESLPPTTRLTLIVSSRTFPNVKQAINTIKTYVPQGRPGLIEFDYILFDQKNMVSVLSAVRDLETRYDQIDYLYFNACYSMFDGIDWAMAVKEMITNTAEAFTYGTFKKQRMSRPSDDGIGAVFQANVFTPWFMVRRLTSPRVDTNAVHADRPLLRKGSKVFWVSSLTSKEDSVDIENDIELTRTKASYEASKRLIDLLHHATYKQLYRDYGVQSFLVEPGLFKSTSFVPSLNFIAYWGMMFTFYLLRWLGSPHHNIDPYKAASTFVYLALLPNLPQLDDKTDGRIASNEDAVDLSIKYGSATHRNGTEYVYRHKVPVNNEDDEKVYNYVEGLYKVWNERLKDQVIDRYLF